MIEVIGRSEYEDYISELQISEDEMYSQDTNYKVAVRNYTSRRHLDINIGIRDGETSYKHLRARGLLMEALEFFPIYKEPVVVRWSNLSPELIEAVKEPGNIILEEAFTSTSANLNYTPPSPREYKIEITHYNGRYIADFSEYPAEEEVLIPAYSHFQVDEYDDARKHVKLTQLNQEQLDEILAQEAEMVDEAEQDLELETVLDGEVE